MPHECYWCEEPASKKCAGCKKQWYCSVNCQRKAWARHIFECNRTKPIPTSYHLYKAAIGDHFPTDPQTLEDYGFSKLSDTQECSYLLGLYRGFFLREVHPFHVNKWLKNGTLIQEIKNEFEKIPPASRGAYYPWFLENQYLLDPNWKPSEDERQKFWKRIWAIIDGDPSVRDYAYTVTTWREKKRECFDLYLVAVEDWPPLPNTAIWINFGFCVCRSEYEWEDPPITRIYKKLIIEYKCPFEKFVTAYESHGLFALFRKYGLEEDARKIQYLDDVLDQEGNKSVWDLKAWVLEPEETYAPIPSIRVDYGIINCAGNQSNYSLLKTTYKKVFDHNECDPIQLHQACVCGRTFEYVDGLLKLKKKQAKVLKGLMKNPYPLPEY